MRKRLLSLLLALCLMLTMMPVPAQAKDTDSGSWDGLTCTYNDRKLTISVKENGNGQMPDYDSTAPYAKYKDKIREVIIGDGVTSIGKQAFSYCGELSSVEFVGDVDDIGEGAFAYCAELTSITSSGKVGNIGNSAFYGCTGLTSFPFTESDGFIGENAFYGCTGFHRLILPEGVTAIMDDAFHCCDNLTAIYIPSSVKEIREDAFNTSYLKDIYFGGTDEEWEQISRVQQYEGLPVVHCNSTPAFPETEAGDAETLRKLIEPAGDVGLAEIELTADITLDDKLLHIANKRNILLDLKGHNITSTVDPVFEIEGSLTVIDSTVNSQPVVDGADNSVTYSSGSIIGNDSGNVIDVLPRGSFTLKSGKVCSSSTDPSITSSGTENAEEDMDSMYSDVRIEGGYVEAAKGIAISVSGVHTQINISDGVVLSGGDAVISITDGTVNGGLLINKSRDFSCGIYQAGSSNIHIYGGKIIVENGVGILVRYGNLWIYDLEIFAGGSGKGYYGGSGTLLDAGDKVVLDQVDANNHGISYYLSESLPDLEPEAYPADEGQELKETDWGSMTRYSFGDIERYTIDFDLKGPELSIDQTETDSNGCIVELPDDPEWDGYVFRGWSKFPYDDINESPSIIKNVVKVGDHLSENTTLYAVWTPDGVHLITFEWPYYRQEYKLTDENGVLDDWPDANKLGPGAGFADDWYFSSDEDSEETCPPDHKFEEDTTVYAHRMPDEPPYTIDFIDPSDYPYLGQQKTNNDGKLENWPRTPAPRHPYYVFNGWYTDGYDKRIPADYRFKRDTRLLAQWIDRWRAETEPGRYLITFDYTGGTDGTDGSGSVELITETGGKLGFLPYSAPVREGYTFDGWFTQEEGGDQVTTDTLFTGTATVYAHWTENGAPKVFTVTFDSKGGTEISQQMVADGEKVAKPADPTREGYTFGGWFKDEDETNIWDFETDTITDSITLYAKWTEKTYTLTVENGTIVSDDDDKISGEFAAGATVSIKADAAPEGKVFDKWTASDEEDEELELEFDDAASPTTSFSMPAKNVTVTATYKDAASSPEETYTVNVENGTIDGDGDKTSGEFAAGATVSIKADPAPQGKVFDKWTSSSDVIFANAANSTTTFTMPANDVTVTATYKDAATPAQTYTLTVTEGTGSGKYAAGAEVTITADPAPEGKVFDKWSSSGGGSFADEASASTTFTMPANDVTVTATYKDATTPAQTYTLTVTEGTGGGKYAAGTEVTITANTAPEGKVFDKWSSSNGGTFANEASASTTFTMPANDVTVTATYKDAAAAPEKTYTVTVTDGTGSGKYAAGVKVTITANEAPDGKVFDKWTSSSNVILADAASSTTIFTMPANDVTVTATYKDASTPAQTYTLTVTGGTGGGEYAEGTEVTITADPAPEGKIFDKWTSSSDIIFADAASATTTFTMPAKNLTVTATYKDAATPEETYTLTVTGGTGGGEYAEGTEVTITADPAPEGKVFDKWSSSGGGSFADEASASTTFTMPANDVTVTAAYKDASTTPGQGAHIIYFDPNGGTVNIPSMATGTDGKLPYLPVPFHSGYVFVGWYTAPTGGSLISINTVFEADTIVYAQWAPESNSSGGSGSSSVTEYAVIASSTTGGTVSVNREFATKGTAITVTVSPDAGYELTSLIARDSRWNELELTDRGGKYTFIMPDRAVTVSAAFTAAAVPQQPVLVVSPSRVWPYSGFSDVPAGTWYEGAVRFVCETGLMKGINNTEFSPSTNISRAQLTQILYNMAGSPAVDSISGFDDVNTGNWYANAASWAVSREIIDGLDSGTFGPSDYLTREEIVVMLWRYAGKPASDRELYFKDTANISVHTLTAVRWAVERGILNGNSGGSLVPKGLATRAEVAQMLKNYFHA